MGEAATSIERACEKRYPAWTLYARALTGNRPDADSIVRGAVRQSVGALRSEAEAHESVLRAIRQSALAGTGGASPSAPSVYTELRDDASETTRRVRLRLRFLPRIERRAIRMVLLRRPPRELPDAARRLGLADRELADVIEIALTKLSGIKAHQPSRARHSDFSELNAYVSGALSGDEARAVTTHARSCSACGDRLGTMMLLKSSVAVRVTTPRFSRGQRHTGATFLTIGMLAVSLFVADAFWPNPWAEHATREPVPGWFHEFFYGDSRGTPSTELSRGLEHIVRGEHDAAISVLTPLAKADSRTPETLAYLGIAQYLSGDVSRGTVRLLEDGTRSHRAGRLSRWYLASAHLSRRNVDGARKELRALTTTRDWFGRAAESLLEQLEDASENLASARVDL